MPIGVIIFPGTGIQDNLADKARKPGFRSAGSGRAAHESRRAAEYCSNIRVHDSHAMRTFLLPAPNSSMICLLCDCRWRIASSRTSSKREVGTGMEIE